MSNPPPIPEGPGMGDELADAWEKYDRLLRRVVTLEDIAERMASTCEDPVAVAELRQWQDEAG